MTTAQYNQCVDAFADGVYRFILKNIRDEDKAQDIVQDSFEKMWMKVGEVSFEKARSYLFTTAYHTMIDAIRRDNRHTALEEEHLDRLTTHNAYSGIKEVLEKAVSMLPEVQRSVVMLRDYEGYTYEEIGEITGLNESQVKVYIYRARTFLKHYIGSMDVLV